MVNPSPLNLRERAQFRAGAKYAGASIFRHNGEYIGMSELALYPGTFSTFVDLDSKTGARIIEVAYKDVFETPTGEQVRKFAAGLGETDKCSVSIQVYKVKKGLFSARWVANLGVVPDSSPGTPEEIRHKEMPIGSAGANSQREIWRQISAAVNQQRPLPFDGTKDAVYDG